jgi:aspartyl-tRNA(Asn)/glutamyl-tRNA(Gln) amidotransferase subunit C
MSAITREQVAHLASLARIELTEAELSDFAGQLGVILSAVASVSEVAADDIPPTTHAVPSVNVFRSDVVQSSLDREAIADSAPATEDGRFRVPRILDEE